MLLFRYLILPLAFIYNELAFENMDKMMEFLTAHKVLCWQNPDARDEQKVFDCRQAQKILLQVYEEKYRKATIKGAV